jgi:hypothetical protein
VGLGGGAVRPPARAAARGSAAAHPGRAVSSRGPIAAPLRSSAATTGPAVATRGRGAVSSASPEVAGTTSASLHAAPNSVAGPSHRAVTDFPTIGTEFYGEECESDDFDHGSDSDGDPENIRFAYRESTWSKNHETYIPEPMPFVEEGMGLTGEYTEIPSYIHLFE